MLLLKIAKSRELIFQISLESSHCTGLVPIFLVLAMKTGCSYNRVTQKCKSWVASTGPGYKKINQGRHSEVSQVTKGTACFYANLDAAG